MKCTNHQDREATKICTTCNKPFCDVCVIVEGDKTTCKKCLQIETVSQQPTKKGGNGWKIALAIVVPLVCLYAFLSIFGLLKDPSSEPGNNDIPAQSQSTQKTGYELSDIDYFINDIKQFRTEFDDNSVAANAKYENKILQITGYVVSVDEFANDKIVYVSYSADDWNTQSLSCYFGDEYKDQALEIKKGDKIIIVGKYNGVIINPVIKECQIINESLQPQQN